LASNFCEKSVTSPRLKELSLLNLVLFVADRCVAE
jgi:hypothetical protein